MSSYDTIVSLCPRTNRHERPDLQNADYEEAVHDGIVRTYADKKAWGVLEPAIEEMSPCQEKALHAMILARLENPHLTHLDADIGRLICEMTSTYLRGFVEQDL
jgi:mannitol-1-phosphate/altronate dehydrogenase